MGIECRKILVVLDLMETPPPLPLHGIVNGHNGTFSIARFNPFAFDWIISPLSISRTSWRRQLPIQPIRDSRTVSRTSGEGRGTAHGLKLRQNELLRMDDRASAEASALSPAVAR
jgi:hypothetical protein